MSEEERTEAEAEPKAEGATKPKKKRLKWSTNARMTVLVVAVAVVAAFAVGFWTWHMTPGFCNAICHKPQDSYIEGYYSGDASLGVTAHADAGLTCLSCHEATIALQMQEAVAWVSDDFTMTEDGFLVQDDLEANVSFCTRVGCHDWESVVKATEDYGGTEGFNPHASHQDGSITCGDCHKIHQASQFYCAKCHTVELPEGWEATSE